MSFNRSQLTGLRARGKELDMELGQKLRKIRIKKGFRTAKDFADYTRTPLSTYSQHETGKRGMSLKVITKYAQALDIKIGDLL